MFKIIFLPRCGNGLRNKILMDGLFGRWWQFTLWHLCYHKLFTWADCLAAVGLVIVSVSCLSAERRWWCQVARARAVICSGAQSQSPVEGVSSFLPRRARALLLGHPPQSKIVFPSVTAWWFLSTHQCLSRLLSRSSRVRWNWSRQQLLTLISDFRDTVRRVFVVVDYLPISNIMGHLCNYYNDEMRWSVFFCYWIVQTLLDRINWKLCTTYAQDLGSNIGITAVFTDSIWRPFS